MQSPYKTIIVYDLETGGLSSKHHSITEIAMVAIDLELLSVIGETSVMLKPYLNLSSRHRDEKKEAREIIKMLKVKDEDSGIHTVAYGNHQLTLKNIAPLERDILLFYEHLERKGDFISYNDICEWGQQEEYKDILSLYFDKCYNPHALEATHINREMLENEGMEYRESFIKIRDFINSHKVGNSKPIMAGHNIGTLPRRMVKGEEKSPDGFDNPFMEKFFNDNDEDFFNLINEKIIDTLKEARLKWYELPSYSLGACANEVGLTLKEAHRALPDALTNARLLIMMLRDWRGGGSYKSTYKRRKYKFQL